MWSHHKHYRDIIVDEQGSKIAAAANENAARAIIQAHNEAIQNIGSTPEEIALQRTIDNILDGPPSDASARDLAAAYEALETKGRI